MDESRHTLSADGDHIESTTCELMQNRTPHYEGFWRSYIVLATFRIIDPKLIHLRPGAPRTIRDMANAAYGSYKNLAQAATLLATDPCFPDGTWYDFVQRLYTARENIRRLLACSRKVVGHYGGAQIADSEMRFKIVGAAAAYGRLVPAEPAVGRARGPEGHDVGVIRVGDMVPRPETAADYSRLEVLSELVNDLARLQRDFVNVGQLAERLLASLCRGFDDVLELISTELKAVPRAADLQRDIATVTSRDLEFAHSMKVGIPLSSWAPAVSGLWVQSESEIGGVQYDELSSLKRDD